MSGEHLREVDIRPPDYKDPATLLRNIAEELEREEYGKVDTVCVALWADTGLETFCGGKDSTMFHAAFVFGAAQTRLLRIPSDQEPDND